ncbi:MAG: hypothetical protein JO215_16795 [Ktedonobacteraceae bacterium]|nr:hypothetical protein [Ktedonobacteraceae bacterium]
MLGLEAARTVSEIAKWGNDLIGKEVPGLPDYRVVRVIQFQLMSRQNGYDAMLLVEIAERPLDTAEQVALRAEDIEVIEELTATVGEPVPGETTLED